MVYQMQLAISANKFIKNCSTSFLWNHHNLFFGNVCFCPYNNFFDQIKRHHDYVQEAIAFVPCKHVLFTCQLLSFVEIPACVGRLLVKHQQLLYKITLFINTGVIQAQGHCLQTLTTTDFPLLRLLVYSIYKSKEDTDKISKTELKNLNISNSETSQNIETSNTSSNDSEMLRGV